MGSSSLVDPKLLRWGLCVSCSHPGLSAHWKALCLEGVLSVCMKCIEGKKQVGVQDAGSDGEMEPQGGSVT